MRSCFLRAFAATDCHGPLNRAHLIRQQTIRRELGLPKPKRRGRSEQRLAWRIVWDKRAWRWACRRHHDELDKARTLRIPRHRIPADVEEYAAEHGILWALDREYGGTAQGV